jgi:hypothetical protein
VRLRILNAEPEDYGTPHLGGATREAMARAEEHLARKLKSVVASHVMPAVQH